MLEEDKVLTLVEFVKSVKVFLKELKKNRFFVAIIVIIGFLSGFLFSYLSKPQYVASSTMMLESSKGGSMSGAMALAGQFGLLSGGGTSTMNEDKLMEIIKAETIIQTALFQKVTIDSATDVLANHFIDVFDYRGEWKSNDSLKDFRFIHTKENLTLRESSVLKMIYGRIVNSCLKVEKSKSGILTVAITTPNELLSKYLNEQLVKSVISYYVDRITEKGRQNIEIVQKRVDSIAVSLRDAELALARWKDGSHQLVKAQGMINEIKLRRNVEVNNSMYIEGVKQLEISKFSLLDQTPFLQIIDQPALPLGTKGKMSLVKGVVGGFILGCLLAGLFVWLRKMLTDVKKELASSEL